MSRGASVCVKSYYFSSKKTSPSPYGCIILATVGITKAEGGEKNAAKLWTEAAAQVHSHNVQLPSPTRVYPCLHIAQKRRLNKKP
jgi:hypothetical protein